MKTLKFVEVVEKKCELGKITDLLPYRVCGIYKRTYFIDSYSYLIVEIIIKHSLQLSNTYRKRPVWIYGFETVKNIRLSSGKLKYEAGFSVKYVVVY